MLKKLAVIFVVLLVGPWTASAVAQSPSRTPGDGPGPFGRYRIGNSADPIEAALDVSRAMFDDGEASRVVLGRSDVFADSLAGSVLTGGAGPLLYVPGGPQGQLPQTILDEITRILPPPSGCQAADVLILGGTGAISSQIEDALVAGGRCPGRFAGGSRVETAVAVAEHALSLFPTTRILLARADDWADAATGGAYAALSGTPIVVTGSDALHPAVAELLSSTSWNDIVLLGGTAALSDDVAEQAASYGPVRRIAGAARDATASAIAQQLWPRTDNVVAVNGYAADGWVYALAGAPAAAALGAPQVYVQPTVVPPATATYVQDYGPIDLVIGVGPASALDDEVIKSLGGGDGQVDAGSQAPPEAPGGGDDGTIPLGTYVCYQGGIYFYDNLEIVDATTYDPQSSAPGTYRYDAGANDIQFLDGSYTFVTRGQYFADGGPEFPDNGPTILLYFPDEDGDEQRVVCGYAED